MTLDRLLSEPQIIINGRNIVTPVDSKTVYSTFLSSNMRPVFFSSDLVHVTRGYMEFEKGGVQHKVPAGSSYFVLSDMLHTVTYGNFEAIVLSNETPQTEGGVYVPGGHPDERRVIVDVTPTVKYFEIADVEGLKLGNHHHQGFDELFHAVQGGFDIHFERPDTKEGGMYRVETGQQVKVPQGVAHLVLPDAGMRMVNVCSAPFESGDLNPYEVTLQETKLR